MTLTIDHGCGIDKQNFLSAESSEIHSFYHHKTWRLYPRRHVYYMIRFWRSSAGEFSFKKSDVIFQGQLSIGHISEIFYPIDVKQKEVHQLDTGWTMWPWSLTSPMALILDFAWLNFKRLYLRNLIDVKRKESKSVRYWVDCMVLPVDHSHDRDLEVSWSKFGMHGNGRADWHETKMMWVDHSWPWPWPLGNHGGMGGSTEQWSGWLQMSACRWHI